MGTAGSSQSSEVGGIAGFNGQASLRRQSPNVARLIRSENSQKMEYEFPISNLNTTNVGRHPYHGRGANHHKMISGKISRHTPDRQINCSDNLLSNNKSSSNETSSLWLSLTGCFGCRTRDSRSAAANPLRDKVHAIRIVRASNDLTPAVFDSHYNIITLEQLRECENNGGGNLIETSESSDPNNAESSYNRNGSVSSSKSENSRRMHKKKKKRAAAAAYAARAMPPADEYTFERTQGND